MHSSHHQNFGKDPLALSTTPPLLQKRFFDTSKTNASSATMKTLSNSQVSHNRGKKRGFDSYFTEVSIRKRIFYIVLVLFVALVALVSIFEPFLTPESCLEAAETGNEFGNSLFKYNPCRYERKTYLLLLSPDECSYSRRLIIAVLLGGCIGWERRQADRPAGIRTMALVSLGSCLFTINSAFAFLDGPMSWDASRISAAIPSGEICSTHRVMSLGILTSSPPPPSS